MPGHVPPVLDRQPARRAAEAAAPARIHDDDADELEPALVLASASVVQSPPSLEEPAAAVDVEASAVLVVPVPGMSPQAATRRRDRARRV